MGVLYSNQFSLIFFVQINTGFLYLIWIGILCILCCSILLYHGTIFCVTVFFCFIVLFIATRWFKYYRDYMCVNKSQFVPVIFEPPCIYSSVIFFLLCMCT
jgi:hypothetical protein